MIQSVRVLCAAGLLGLAGGCRGADPMLAWQRSLEAYVTENGNGDPDVLRTLDDRPSQGEFGLTAARKSGFPFVAPQRTDVNGLLLGHRRIAGRYWFLFLVGAVEYRGTFVNFPVDDPRLQDLRIAAFSGEGGLFHWLMSGEDTEAIQRYERLQIQAWRRSHPSRAQATMAPTTFPTAGDILRLTVMPEGVTVVDEHSGARWVLSMETPAGVTDSERTAEP